LQIIGAPSFFPTVWNWIKRWFDPVTVSKIFILSSAEVKSTLETFIEPSSIPSQYGGTLDFKWGDLPNMDDAARALAGGLESPPTTEGGKPVFLKGPVRFFNDHMEVLGSDQGKPRRESIPVPPTGTATTKEVPAAAVAVTEAPAPTAQVADEKVEPVEPVAAPVEATAPAA
jgi:hypothetical protein